jgi:4-hydroxybenzoate polyprenyltransferase
LGSRYQRNYNLYCIVEPKVVKGIDTFDVRLLLSRLRAKHDPPMTAIPIDSIAIKPSGLRAQWLRLCVAEARPIVLLIYVMRFMVAYAVTVPTVSMDVELWRLPVALVTWVLAAASVYLFDGVTDVVEDRLNGSTRPIARGALPGQVALSVSVAWAALSVLGAVLLGGPYVFLVPALLLLGYAYSGRLMRLKRWSPAAGATVLIAGLLTFAAGGAVSGQPTGSMTLIVFAMAMSSWMGFVGVLAKDFSDVPGDALTGRRTCAVVKGVRRAAWRLSVNACGVAASFLVAAAFVDRLLLWPAAVVAVGALAVANGCRPRSARSRPRRAYRAFMLTQYLAHAVVGVAVLWP